MNVSHHAQDHAAYVLRFHAILGKGRGYAFPCDAAGQVDIDALSFTARQNYFFARTVIGRELSMPAVEPGTVN